MPVTDEDEPSPGELEALLGGFADDPALRAELELILPALDPAARRAFGRAIARADAGPRPAAAVLAALVAAAGAGSGRHRRGRD
jgi:hypothetical protein